MKQSAPMDDAERRARRVRARRARRRRRQALGIVTVLVVGGGVTALAWPGTRPAASASRGPSLGPDTAVTSGNGRRASRAGEKRTTRTTKTPVPILTYHVVAAP